MQFHLTLRHALLASSTILLAFSFSSPTYSQSLPDRAMPGLRAELVERFRHVTTSDGLSSDEITAIEQDSAGYIWIGTRSGLNRFDGQEITIFRGAATGTGDLFNDQVTALAHDGNSLWVSVKGALHQYIASEDRFTTFLPSRRGTEGLLDGDVRTLMVDSDSNLWIGSTRGVSLFEHTTRQFTHFEFDPADPTRSIRPGSVVSLFEDRDKNIWISTLRGDRSESHGVTQLSPDRRSFSHYVHSPQNHSSLQPGAITTFAESPDGTVWLASSRGGVSRYQPNSNDFERLLSPDDMANTNVDLSTLRVNAMAIDDTNTMWLGTLGEGLVRVDLDTRELRAYQGQAGRQDSIRSNQLSAVLLSDEGTLWSGSLNRGVSLFNPHTARFNYVRLSQTRDSNRPVTIQSIRESATNAHQLIVKETGPIEIQFEGEPSSGLVSSVKRIAGDSPCLLTEQFRERCERLGVSKSLKTRDGSVLLLSRAQGLVRISNTDLDWELLPSTQQGEETRSDALAGIYPTDIVEDDRGVIWITSDLGLNRFNPRTGLFDHFVHNPADDYSLPSNNLRQLLLGEAQTLWLASDVGLIAFDRNTELFEHYTTRNGLSSDRIQCMLSTGETLWLATSDGLTRWNIATRSATRFYREDGLQSNEFTSGACHRGASGNLYFAGSLGYNFFRSDSILEDLAASRVAVKSLRLNQRETTRSQDMATTVAFDEDLIEIEFGAIDYSVLANNSFQVKLEPFDPEWRDMQDDTNIFYTNLSAGSYVFNVRSVNRFGLVSDVSQMPLVKQGHPLLSSWALISYLLVAGIAALLLYRGNQRKLQRQRDIADRERQIAAELRNLSNYLQNAREEERAALARELHDELAQTLVALKIEMSLLNKAVTNEETTSVVARLPDINQIIETGVDSIRQITRGLRPAMLEEKGLVAAIQWHLSENCGRAGVESNLDTNCENLKLPSATQTSIYRIAQELITNALKHASAQHLNVSLRQFSDKLVLVVRDDGRGEVPLISDKEGHFGLIGIRERASAHHGEVEITANEPSGITVTVTIPLESEQRSASLSL